MRNANSTIQDFELGSLSPFPTTINVIPEEADQQKLTFINSARTLITVLRKGLLGDGIFFSCVNPFKTQELIGLTLL